MSIIKVARAVLTLITPINKNVKMPQAKQVTDRRVYGNAATLLTFLGFLKL